MAGSQLDAFTSPVARERWKYSRLNSFSASLNAASASALAVDHGEDAGSIRGEASLDVLPRELMPPDAAYPLVRETLETARTLTHLFFGNETTAISRLTQTGGANVCFVDLREQASATLELLHEAAAPAHGALFVRIGANAQLTLSQSLRDQEALSWTYLGIDIEAGGRLSLQQTILGSGEHRLESRIRLLGPGAEVEVTGATLATDKARLDQQLTMEHVAARCLSNQRIHCAAAAGGRSTFNGRIHIHPRAPGTQADLTNRNLLLADNAEINSKPELEIYTDDVRCSHGSTVGALDPEALFFLKARGIPPHLARRLLVTGFLNQVLKGTMSEDDRAVLSHHLEADR